MSFRTNAQLNINRLDVQKDIADRDLLHKRLMSLFPSGLGDRPRQAVNLLFTVNANNGELIMQSDLKPNITAFDKYKKGYFSALEINPTHVVDLSFTYGDSINFKLWYAALERITGFKKRENITDETKVLTKVSALLKKVGLIVNEVNVLGWDDISSARRKVGYKNAQLTGQGFVVDADKLREGILRGVGGMRVWGSGVLITS